MLPLCWLNLGSLYLTLTTINTPCATIAFAFGKTIISYLITNTSSTLMDISMPWVAQPHNELEVQNSELFVQTFHFCGPLDKKEVKHICTLLLLPPFLICWVFILFHTLEHQSFIVASNLMIIAQLFIKVQIFDSFV
jgi:hypothetical protein